MKDHIDVTWRGEIEQIKIPSLRNFGSISLIEELIKNNEIIKAIKEFRLITFYGLKESKLFIEYWRDNPSFIEDIKEATEEEEWENKVW